MSRNIGIDLGTASVLVYLEGRGIVLNEPSLVAVDQVTQRVIAVGHEAYEMRGRTSESIEVIQPLKAGVISDYDLTEAMLILFFKKINYHRAMGSPRVLISTPTSISEIERLSLYEAVEKVTHGRIYIEPEPLVAGAGSGLDIISPRGSMVVDIGGGTTDIAVFSAGEMLYGETLKLAGDDIDEAILQYFRDKFQLLVGIRSAETVKKQVAAAVKQDPATIRTAELRGRDLVTGLPKAINVDENDLYYAINPVIEQIEKAIRRNLEEAPPEIVSDIYEQGIMLTGGGALIRDLDTRLSEYLKVTVMSSTQALQAVALGTGIMMDWIGSGQLKRSQSKKDQRSHWFARFWRRIWG